MAAATCGKDKSPAAPNPTPVPAGPKLTAPAPSSPSDGAAAGSFRPALVVSNGTSDQSGAKLYEFQISDRSDFEDLLFRRAHLQDHRRRRTRRHQRTGARRQRFVELSAYVPA